MGGDLSVRNRVILALEPAAQTALMERALTRPLTAGETVFEEGAPLTHLVFPHAGVVSLATEMQDGRWVETASIGLEGFVGFAIVLGSRVAIRRSTVEVGGRASWLAVRDLDDMIATFPAIREQMLRYVRRLMLQLMQAVACNATHSAEARIARWLLSTQDRVESDRFEVTQQAVADLLGLRRATVTQTSAQLESQGLIEHSRGVVRIVDRAALEKRACECYGKVACSMGFRRSAEASDEDAKSAPPA